jgi:hypothetical protein
MFTEPFPRSGLKSAVVPLLLGADDIENAAPSIVACWAVFTELLPGNALLKSVLFSLLLCAHQLGPNKLSALNRNIDNGRHILDTETST